MSVSVCDPSHDLGCRHLALGIEVPYSPNVYTHARTHAPLYPCPYTRLRTCLYTRRCTRPYSHAHTHVCTHMPVHAHVYPHGYSHVYAHFRTYVHAPVRDNEPLFKRARTGRRVCVRAGGRARAHMVFCV